MIAREIYHCYNRGVDKQRIFKKASDYDYFLKSLENYNSPVSAGMLRLSKKCDFTDQPVTIYAYCLLPNHFHIVAAGKSDGAISRLLQRVGIGYTLYFNQKYKRSGGLFQGTFKSTHIVSDQDFRQVVGYVGYNFHVHGITKKELYRSHISPEVGGLTSYSAARFVEIADIIRTKRLALE